LKVFGLDGDTSFTEGFEGYSSLDPAPTGTDFAVKPAWRLAWKNATPLAKKLLNHYMDGTGTPITLTEDEMVGVGARVDIRRDPAFAPYISQLHEGGADVNVPMAEVFLRATTGGTLGRFFGVFQGKIHGTSSSDWTFTGTMRFSDTWDFDPQDWNFPNTRSYDPNKREPVAEYQVRFADWYLPGKDFDVDSVAVPVSQGANDEEANWKGKGVKGTDGGGV